MDLDELMGYLITNDLVDETFDIKEDTENTTEDDD